MTYERIGRERLSDLAWLCGPCHRALHRDDPAGGLFDPARAIGVPQRDHGMTPEQRDAHNAQIRAAIKARQRRRPDPPPGSERVKRYGGYLAKRGEGA